MLIVIVFGLVGGVSDGLFRRGLAMLFFALRFLLVLAIAQYTLLVSRLSADNEMRAGSVVLAVIVMMVFLASAMPAVASNATATFEVVIKRGTH